MPDMGVFASFSGRLPKGRKVCEAQRHHKFNAHHLLLSKADEYGLFHLQCLAYQTEPMNSGLIIYNVACQWSLNFHRHVQDSDFLSLGHITDLIPVVGKFHLAAHVPSCFARFSLNFVQGAGQLDGGILETLWSEFNKVSASARSMSKAHRAEVCDDHMRDSNWKKLVGMGE